MLKETNNMKSILSVLLVGLCALTLNVQAQQDPHYTQYMYNTMSVNPAYVGSRGHTTITALGRTQWVGFEGAPDTQTLSYDTPIGLRGLGLGFNLVNDNIGPSHETYLDGNLSYTIDTGEDGNLAFGLKLGARLLNIDWSEGNIFDASDENFENVRNKFLPTIGAGIYYYKPKWYLGLAVPNFLGTEHYNADNPIGEVAVERMHFFLIAGYVFNLSDNIKFKPAALAKAVSGAPLSIDVSGNFMFYEKFIAGLAWRWDDAISLLLGFQATDAFYLGYAYDLTTSNYRVANSGTHEIMLRYEIFREKRLISPRFF